MPGLDARAMAERLQALQAEGMLRSRRSVERESGTEAHALVNVDGIRCIDFCSNDYLGLANHPAVTAAFRAAAEAHGVGARAAHLVSGHHPEHAALEIELAQFTGRERALLFSTGYMANLGAVTALAGRGGMVHEDRLNHASLLDAGLLSQARLWRYPHGDATSVATRLASQPGRHSLVVTDGVFSMDGDLAPLPALAAACRKHNALLLVDDAHGLGVLGRTGGGTAEHFGLSPSDVPVLVGTLGKAFGTFGAFVAGDTVMIETLIQRARSYIYTTALPPAIAAATRAALRAVREETWRRDQLNERIAQFRREATAAQLPLMPSLTPIQPVMVGDAASAAQASTLLLQHGLLLSAIRPPTVPAGSSRLRVTLSTLHSAAQVTRLVTALAKILAGLRP